MLERVIHAADVAYNGVGLPVEDGGVLTSGEHVVAFGRLEDLRRANPGARVERAGRAILPRPVNAHTHLDLSAFPYHEAAFPDWIPWLVAHGRANPGRRGEAAARDGLERIRRSGAAAFGDIVAAPDVMRFLLEESELPGVAYYEVLDPNPDRARDTMRDVAERVRSWRKLERPGGVRVGLSPHAPYTVSAALMRELAAFASLEGVPLQVHLAESPAESAMLRDGTGGLADGITRAFDVSVASILGRDPDAELTPVRYLADLGVLDARPTLVHAVNVTDDDVRAIAQAGCAVVTCPRSNRALQCGVFPWALFARYGVEVGLGTDSVASGGSLDVRDEAMAALDVHGPALGLRAVVRWAVKGGYRALGLKPPVVRRGDAFTTLAVWP